MAMFDKLQERSQEISEEISEDIFLPPTPRAPFVDGCGRTINYLRISVTDRCDLRCRYCMPQRPDFLPKKDLLTLEELYRVACLFVSHGIETIRITGGEPLVRKNLLQLLRQLGDLISAKEETGFLKSLTITTNGTHLTRFAEDLFACGIRRVNISLDSLDAATFSHMTRGGSLEVVLEGIDAALKAGLAVKINCVALAGVNVMPQEVDRMLAWCGEKGCDLTYIEVMPMGDIGNEKRIDQFYPLTELRRSIAERWNLDASSYRSGGPARYLRCVETDRRIGFISPLTENFCDGCTRVRVTCTGMLYPCLGQESGSDLRAPLRDHPDDDEQCSKVIAARIAKKTRGHAFVIDGDARPSLARTMNTTGG